MAADQHIDPKDLIPRAVGSQGTEYFHFKFYRAIGFVTFLTIIYTPLYIGQTFAKELNYLFHDDRIVLTETVIVIAMSVTIYTGTFCIMNLIYTLKHPFFEKFKSNTQSWPWETDPEGWPAERNKQLRRTYFNLIVLNGSITCLFGYLGANKFNINFDDLPSYPTLLLQVLFCFVMADFTFYWLHRLSHHPKIYWIHKHHHEAENPTVTNTISVHPLEFIFVDIVTGIPGVAILGSQIHYVTLISFYLWLWISNLDDHLGYEFPWNWSKIFPWSATNTFHNYHHLVNIGNYAAHTILWDSIFGTSSKFVGHFEAQEGLRKDKNGTTQIKLKAD